MKAAGTVIFTAVRATSLMRMELDDVRVAHIHLKAEKIYNQAGIVWLRGRTPSPAGKLLIEELQRLAGEGGRRGSIWKVGETVTA